MKTIDVQDGDTWTRLSHTTWLYQYRNNRCRWVDKDDKGWWTEDERQGTEEDVSANDAVAKLTKWDYTITKPEQAVVCSTCRTFGCDDHVPDAGKMVPDLAATVKRLEQTINLVRESATKNAMYCNELERRVAKLEAATFPHPPLHTGNTEPLPGGQSPYTSPTPAKVRVVAPEADGLHTPVWRDGWRQADRAWRAAITAGNIEIVEASK